MFARSSILALSLLSSCSAISPNQLLATIIGPLAPRMQAQIGLEQPLPTVWVSQPAQQVSPNPVVLSETPEPNAKLIEQQTADVLQQWAEMKPVIATLHLAYKCGLADEVEAQVAVRQIQIVMSYQAVAAGLIGSDTLALHLENVTMDAIHVVDKAVSTGICEKLSPADKGRIWESVRLILLEYRLNNAYRG